MPSRRSSCGSGPCRFGGRTGRGPIRNLLILPWTAGGKRAFNQNCQPSSLTLPRKGTHFTQVLCTRHGLAVFADFHWLAPR